MAEHFYRITCILRNGSTKQGVIKHTSSEVDIVYLIYFRQAEERFGGNLDEFDCVKLSKYDKQVKKLMKGTIIHVPLNESVDLDWIDIPPDPNRKPGKTRKQQYAEDAERLATKKRQDKP